MLKICTDCRFLSSWECTKQELRTDYVNGHKSYTSVWVYREEVCGIEEARFFEPMDTPMVNRIRNFLKENFGV